MNRHPARHKTGYALRCNNRSCNAFGSRVTRRLAPHEYVGAHRRLGQCRCCKRDLSIDWYRTTGRENRANKCRCNGYAFPHRRGSLYCQHFTGPIARRADGMYSQFFTEVAA
jgi:hypothetical protein